MSTKRDARCNLGVAFFFSYVLVCTGCALAPSPRDDASGRGASRDHANAVPLFSAAAKTDPLPPGWKPWRLSRFKRSTQYQLAVEEGITVVRATADGSASGLVRDLEIDPAKTPWLSWRWRVPQLIASADNTQRDTEDAPVRIVVTFAGDTSKFDIEDQAVASRVKALTGQAMPYATLMYIWENRQPVGRVIDNFHTSRVKMIVAESGPERRGRWLHFSRHIADDYKAAFGEVPGQITSIGILTDTDNTGETTDAYYGDIAFSAMMPNATNKGAAPFVPSPKSSAR